AMEPGAASVTLTVVIVVGSIASLKVALIFWLKGTPVAPLTGSVALTVGAVVSGAAPVVKLQLKAAARVLPARSRATVVMVAVKVVLAARGLSGVNVAVVPA